MVLSALMILIVDSTTRFSWAKGVFNIVYRQFVDNCRGCPVTVIPHRQNTRGVALGCLIFRPHRRLLRNTPFRLKLSYHMRYPFSYYSSALPSCTSPVFTNNAIHHDISPSVPRCTHTTVSHTTHLPFSNYRSLPRPSLPYPLHCDRPSRYPLLLFSPSIFCYDRVEYAVPTRRTK